MRRATQPELHARRLEYRQRAGIRLFVLLVLVVMSILPTDDDAGSVSTRATFFAPCIFCSFCLFLVLSLIWMGACGLPELPLLDNPLVPLYSLVPFATFVILWLLPNTLRQIISYIMTAVSLLVFVAAMVQCYKLENAFDFSVKPLPQDEEVELFDNDNAGARGGSSDSSKATLGENALHSAQSPSLSCST